MNKYKSKVDGDFIILYDEKLSMPEIKIFSKGLSSLISGKKNEKAKEFKDRINGLYDTWDKVKDKILNKKIGGNKNGGSDS